MNLPIARKDLIINAYSVFECLSIAHNGVKTSKKGKINMWYIIYVFLSMKKITMVIEMIIAMPLFDSLLNVFKFHIIEIVKNQKFVNKIYSQV